MDAIERDLQNHDDARVWTPDTREPAGRRFEPSRRFSVPWTSGPIREGAVSRRILARDAFYRRSLASSDLFAALGATAVAATLAGDGVSLTAFTAAPLVVLLAKVLRLYERDELLVRKTTLEEAPALFQLASVFTLAVWVAHDSLGVGWFDPAHGVLLWPLLFVALVLARAGARRVAKRVTEPERCIVIGSGAATESLKQSFDRTSRVNANVIGRVPLQYGQRSGEDPIGAAVPCSIPFLGDIHTLGEILTTHRVDRVLVAPGAGATEETLDVIRAVKSFGVKVSIVPRLFEVIGSSAAFDDVEGTTLLGVPRYGLSRSSKFMKRAVDVLVADVILLATSPLLVVIALAIKFDSPGPVLFRQRRIGQDGREFEMVKFRTMIEHADELKYELAPLNEADGLFKIANDPRITRVGRFLRKTYLDEIPQLWNVLRGEMSLVGPRPLVPDDDEQVQGWDRRRLHVPPGMTGHWQVLGSSRVPLGEMVKIDYLYGANWSLWGDLKILLRTIPYVLTRRGL